MSNEQSGLPGIDPCAKCGFIPTKVDWDCSDAPRIIHSELTCERRLKERKAIDAWNVKQREASRGLPF